MQTTTNAQESVNEEVCEYSLHKIRLFVLGDNIEMKRELQKIDTFLK